MKPFAQVLSLIVSLGTFGACGETSPTAPAAPAPEPPPTFTLSGLVVTSASSGMVPVDEAQLRILSPGDRFPTLVTTGASGRYSVSGLHVGSKLSISASKEGYEPKTTSVTMSGDRELEIQIVPLPKYTISGVVFEMTPAGPAPVAGVRLHWSELHLDAESDAKGFYSLNVFHGTSSLWASKDGYIDKQIIVAISSDMRLDVALTRQ